MQYSGWLNQLALLILHGNTKQLNPESGADLGGANGGLANLNFKHIFFKQLNIFHLILSSKDNHQNQGKFNKWCIEINCS